MKDIKEATKRFLQLKQTSCDQAGRENSEVTAIAASKTQSINSIHQAYEGGIINFGENYADRAEVRAMRTSEVYK